MYTLSCVVSQNLEMELWTIAGWDTVDREYSLTTHTSQKARNHGVTKYRSSLVPGTVLILLAGRFRGKRVVLLKTLDQGVLLVTGPFKVNGVPLRRVNARYVIATSAKVDLKGIDDKTVEKVTGAGYFSKEKKSKDDKSEEAFFKQGEKPQVSTTAYLSTST